MLITSTLISIFYCLENLSKLVLLFDLLKNEFGRLVLGRILKLCRRLLDLLVLVGDEPAVADYLRTLIGTFIFKFSLTESVSVLLLLRAL